MTEEDRDRMEQEAQQIISMRSEQIVELQGHCEHDIFLSIVLVLGLQLLMVSAATEGENEQARQCREEIVNLLQDYLKGSMFL